MKKAIDVKLQLNWMKVCSLQRLIHSIDQRLCFLYKLIVPDSKLKIKKTYFLYKNNSDMKIHIFPICGISMEYSVYTLNLFLKNDQFTRSNENQSITIITIFG